MIDALYVAETASWMERWFDVTEPWQLWWLGLGTVAQGFFLGRWIIQWIATERRQEPYVPELFWWCSLIGATMLLIYFIGRREPVGVMGQLTGWIVYGRNLYLMRTKARRIIEDVPAVEPAELLDECSS